MPHLRKSEEARDIEREREATRRERTRVRRAERRAKHLTRGGH